MLFCAVSGTLPFLSSYAPTHTHSLSSLPFLQMFVCLENSSSPFKCQSKGSQSAPSTDLESSCPELPASVHSTTQVMTTLCPDQFYVSVLTNCELPVGRKSGFCLYHVKPRASAHIRFFTNVGPVGECTSEAMTPSLQLALVRGMAQLQGPRNDFLNRATKLWGYPVSDCSSIEDNSVRLREGRQLGAETELKL